VHGLQAPELLDNEEQEEAFRSRGAQEVLPLVRQAHDAQGNPLGVCSSAGRCRPCGVLTVDTRSGARSVPPRRIPSSAHGTRARLPATAWKRRGVVTCGHYVS